MSNIDSKFYVELGNLEGGQYLSSLKPEDLLPESPEIQRNLQHLLTDVEVMVGLKCHRLGYGNIQEVAVP
ncbi:hypothetical protein O3M35_000662 [Rhynocoris fuscipes]|uniref:Uncharacterized protein n=1 Tax=Rhynocoris fuscipes TaxID=488301 RepID=A0AAW1DPJ5_9HEMI